MPSCIQNINNLIESNQIDSIVKLTPSTLTSIFINGVNNQLFFLETIKQETVKFSINLTPSGQVSNINITISIFLLAQTSPILLGSVLMNELFISFQQDLSPGSYIICISTSRYSYTGNFYGEFTGFQSFLKLKPNFYCGENVSVELSFTPRDKECNKTIYYEIVEGSLPPGLTMTSLGNIYGVLPNMDCIKDNEELSPSQNWYYNIENTWTPWGRQWRFKIKIWLPDFPQAFKEEWFCIRVHNNWSYDKDNMKLSYDYVIDSIELPEPTKLDNLCCDPQEIAPEITPEFKPMPIPVTCPCDNETQSEKALSLNFLQWYESHLNSPNPSEEINNFVETFRKTDYYKKLMDQFNISIENDPIETEKQNVSKLIQIYLNDLIEGRNETDLDYQMLINKNEINQSLPITIIGEHGTFCSLELN